MQLISDLNVLYFTVVVIYARDGLGGFSNFIPSPIGKEDEEPCAIKKLQCIKGLGNFL